uniref:ARAD1C38214p n=1 Tax=Blastobotrys adeninivorans TaxID=409370 RepID=A0A060T419_BLAAD
MEPRYRPAAQDEDDSDGSRRSSVSTILENINRIDAGRDLEKQGREDELLTHRRPGRLTVSKRSVVRGIVATIATVIVFIVICAYSTSQDHHEGSATKVHPISNGTTTTSAGVSSTPVRSAIAETETSTRNLLEWRAWRSGQYRPTYQSISWIGSTPDGQGGADFMEIDGSKYVVGSWEDPKNVTTILPNTHFSYEDGEFEIRRASLSHDRKRVIVGASIVKNWRHSTFGVYFVYDIESDTYSPVNTEKYDELLSLAVWSPRGDRIAFVKDNNLYLRYVGGSEDGTVKQITHDGGEQVFYGRPDWVYEEEVFSGDKALWWSESGEYLAFLRTNETEVKEFPIPYFVQGRFDAYPEVRQIKYPKPGSPNPVVDIQFLEISSEEYYSVPTEENPAKDDLITEVVWAGSNQVLVRHTNRESDMLKMSVIDTKKRTGTVTRTEDMKGRGWFEITHNLKYVPANGKERKDDGYIDTIVVDGFDHLAYFSPVDSSSPKHVLTSGQWEVVDAPSAVDEETGTVYFFSTQKSPVERQLYSVDLEGKEIKNVTDNSKDGFYRASFSANSRYALITYEGPEVPWQRVVDLKSDDPMASGKVIQKNSVLKSMLKQIDTPEVVYSQIEVDEDDNGQPIVANAMEIRPPGFDESKKYPVLFFVYGGPVSQMVQKKYSVDFQRIVSSQLDAIVVTVDGRGTGFMGREFRSVVRDRLGYFEARDQIAGAKEWKSRDYVDSDRIAIWGWSYGGYLTLKTLETDAGQNFRYGMAVAPVTDWRLYDSIYTERYMHTPKHNPKGYMDSRISNTTAIAQNERFLIMHGTGDDNVHFQHTLLLLDQFDLSQVENYDIHVFPDSDHSIAYHNANSIVYDKLFHWLSDAFSGRFKDFQ